MSSLSATPGETLISYGRYVEGFDCANSPIERIANVRTKHAAVFMASDSTPPRQVREDLPYAHQLLALSPLPIMTLDILVEYLLELGHDRVAFECGVEFAIHVDWSLRLLEGAGQTGNRAAAGSPFWWLTNAPMPWRPALTGIGDGLHSIPHCGHGMRLPHPGSVSQYCQHRAGYPQGPARHPCAIRLVPKRSRDAG